MLRNKFSAAILSLVVAVGACGTAYATEMNQADLSNETSVSVSDSAEGTVLTETIEVKDTINVIETEKTENPQNAGNTPEAVKEDTEDKQTADVVEPSTGVVDGEKIVDAETPAVEEQPAETIIEGSLPVVEPEVVTDAAIAIEEPVAATLTITHRLMVGDAYKDMIQTIDGLEKGKTMNIAEYVVTEKNVVCISDVSDITIDEEQDTIVLEYNLVEMPNVEQNSLEK